MFSVQQTPWQDIKCTNSLQCSVRLVVRWNLHDFHHGPNRLLWHTKFHSLAHGRPRGSGPTSHLLCYLQLTVMLSTAHNHCSLLFWRKIPIPRLQIITCRSHQKSITHGAISQVAENNLYYVLFIS